MEVDWFDIIVKAVIGLYTVNVIKLKNAALLVHIRNSFDGRIEMSEGERFPKSTKSSPQDHGIGMENIARIADRYYGGITFETLGNEFALHVMLQDRELVEE